MSVRRLPPGDSPFRPLRCRDVALLLLGVAVAAVMLAAVIVMAAAS